MDTFVLDTGAPCNNGCASCAPEALRVGAARGAPGLSLLQERVSAGRREGMRRLLIMGGEPTLNPHLEAAIRFARGAGYEQVVLRTNGRLFCYRERAAAVAAAGVDIFEVSLHGHEARIHDHLTRSPDSFIQTLSAMKTLAALGQNVVCATVICRPNVRHLPEIARLAVGAGVAGLRWSVIDAPAARREAVAALVVRQELAAPWLMKALDFAAQAGKTAVVSGIPACMLGRHGERAEAKTARPTAAHPCAWSERAEPALGPECGRCSRLSACAGPSSAYVERFGWKEFVPV